MASAAQTAANQRNAHKSTGPRTREGKAVSRTNAQTHGCTSIAVYKPVPGEDPASFEETRRGLVESWLPANPQEQQLVEMIASAWNRMHRSELFEAATFNQACDSRPGVDPAIACAESMGVADNKLRWNNLDRYRRAAWLDYNRSVEQLRRIQKERREQPDRELRAFIRYQDFLKRNPGAAEAIESPASPAPPSADLDPNLVASAARYSHQQRLSSGSSAARQSSVYLV